MFLCLSNNVSHTFCFVEYLASKKWKFWYQLIYDENFCNCTVYIEVNKMYYLNGISEFINK